MHKGSIHDRYYGSGIRIINSIQKYGKENHIREILEILPDDTTMRKREEEIITEELLKNPLCLNLIKGGRGGWAYLKGIDPKRYSQQIMKGVETRKKLGSIKRSTACKKLISERAKGRTLSIDNINALREINRKSIIQFDLYGNFIKKWESIRNCSNSLHISHCGIIRCLKNQQLTYKGFIWSYY